MNTKSDLYTPDTLKRQEVFKIVIVNAVDIIVSGFSKSDFVSSCDLIYALQPNTQNGTSSIVSPGTGVPPSSLTNSWHCSDGLPVPQPKGTTAQ